MSSPDPTIRTVILTIDAAAVARQSGAVMGVLRRGLADAQIVGLYLYGSAVAGSLRPDSDLDLFAVVDRGLTGEEKARIVDGLLPISGRETRPPSWRPIELTVVAQPKVRPWRYPPRMELQYGEWLRADLVEGHVEPDPAENPDLGVLITMVRQISRPLLGPPATEVLDAVPRADLVRAMTDGVPSLLADLADDTRNVLLTLARIWATIATGEILSKDEAADWVLPRLPDELQPMLARARDLYLVGGYGDPWRSDAVRLLADHLVGRILAARSVSG